MRARTLIGGLAMAAALAAHPAYTDEPLDPEQAFALGAAVSHDARGKPKAIELRYTIAPGYYLYRERFKFEAPGLGVGPARLPQGLAKNDPFVGPARIFKRAAVITLPLPTPPAPGDYAVAVTSQGCAEDRVCYAPLTQTVTVRIR